MPVKNEAWILKTTIPQLIKFADEILCLDGGSTDGTVDYLKSQGVFVKNQTEKKTNFSAWRLEALEWGRERGGTHFIWLDADEAFTTNFLVNKDGKKNFRNRLSDMKPGEKLAMQWLCLWKSPYVYRDDMSVWSNLYKDFIIRDDGKVTFDNTLIHEGRTPGPNFDSEGKLLWKKISLEEGGVLHFQFVPFERFQIKQAYQRAREHSMKTASPRRINNKYSQTLDVPNVQTKSIPKEWLAGINGLDSISLATDSYYIDSIREFFKEKGILYFEPIQLWQVPELKKIFISEIGREPHIKTYPAFVVASKKIYDAIKAKLRNMIR